MKLSSWCVSNWSEGIGKMTVALSTRSGDKGVARGDAATAAGVAPVCLSPALRHPQCAAAWHGSRFWALAEDSSEDDDDAASVRSLQSSPPRPSQVTVGDFLSAAFANPSAGSVGVRRCKRSAFAPGGRGPRWLSRLAAGERCRQPSPPTFRSCVSPARVAGSVAPACASVCGPSLVSSVPPSSLAPAAAPDLDPDPSPVVAPAPLLPLVNESR
jgi:hypothetical protein